MKELNEEQINFLFSFMERKYVKYYDLQVELVDHFACIIEEKWAKEPNLLFDEAVYGIYSEYGVFGFCDLVEKHEKQKRKSFWKQSFQYFKAYFRLPKVILAVCIFLVYYSVSQILRNTDISSLLFLFIIQVIIATLVVIKNYRLPKRKDNKKFLGLRDMRVVSNTFGFNVLYGFYIVNMFQFLDSSSKCNVTLGV